MNTHHPNNMSSLKELKKKAMGMAATIQIGKSGLTDGTIAEIKKQLKKRKLVKVKLLRSFHDEADKDETARSIAEKTGSILVARTGFIIVLYKGILKG